MQDFLTSILNYKLAISLIITLILMALRALLIRVIRRKSVILSEDQLRWTSRAKNLILALIFFLWVIIWWQELHRFALSIAAVAVALVIASKELILCLSGAILRTTAGISSVGDWIEIGDIRGEVVEQNVLSTVLQEIDKTNNSYDYTGKTITLPNSIFLNQSVRNMHFMRRFVFHSFSIYTQPDVNIFEAKQLIRDKLELYCSEFKEVGKRYHALIVNRSGMAMPAPDFSVRISTNNISKNNFTVSLFCPTNQAITLEQKITEDFFNFYYEKKNTSGKQTINIDD